jgi:two-component system OmpR family response regulator
MFNHNRNSTKPASAQILTLQREVTLRIELANSLTAMGYDVVSTALPGEVLSRLTENLYDALVLDLDCFQPDDLSFLHNVGELQPRLPIIILTSKPTLRTAIAAVRIGATDYLIKPIDVSIIVQSVSHSLETLIGLKNQIARLIREAGVMKVNGDRHDSPDYLPPGSKSTIIVPPVRLDSIRRTATLFENPQRMIELSRGELAILLSLMSYPNQPLTAEQLARYAWGYDLDRFEARDLVRPYVHRLRRKLENNPVDPSLILTVRGQGYLFSSGRRTIPSAEIVRNEQN